MKKLLALSFLLLTKIAVFSQNNHEVQDIRDAFIGTYQRLNYTCSVSGSTDIIVSKHPTKVDLMYIEDGIMIEYSSGNKHKVKINSDSTWIYDSWYKGNFKRKDTIMLMTGPVICGFTAYTYGKKIVNTIIVNNIFYDPSTNIITITNSLPSTVEIFNIEGQIVNKIKFDISTSISLEQLSGGVYIIKVSSGNEIITKKIIKE